MGSTFSTFVDNIPIVWVVKKLSVLIPETVRYPLVSLFQIILEIFIPKQGPPPREIPQVMGNLPASTGVIDQIKSIDQNTLIYLVGGSILLIILLR